jgi:hypothetical protein
MNWYKKAQTEKDNKTTLIFSLKRGFQKIAEPIEIDGKWYDEQNNEMIEIPGPTKGEPASRSITIPVRDYKYIFEEGGIYSDAAGNYRVDKILDENKIKVTYIDGQFSGQERTYSAFDRAKIIYNEERRQDAKNKMTTVQFNEPNHYFTLGYLAKNSKINVEVPSDQAANFEAKYRDLTGDDAKTHSDNYYVAPKQENRWHVKCRLRFSVIESVMPNLSFPSDVKFNNVAGAIQIDNNNYVYNLFRHGFKIGRNVDNYNGISAGLNGKFKEAFDDGFNA